jgi:hypothetical protein
MEACRMSCGGIAWEMSMIVRYARDDSSAPFNAPTYPSERPKSVVRVTMAVFMAYGPAAYFFRRI